MKQQKQFFIHYQKWEDFQNGMYRVKEENGKDLMVFNAINLLKNQEEFYSTMMDLINDWNISVKVNLTNNQQNKRAWLGAAACCYKYNVPEYLTRIAWNLLDKNYQVEANITAEKIITYYNNKNIIQDAKTLFED